MRIALKLFAFFRQMFGSSQITYEIADGATVSDLLEEIYEKYPPLEKSRGHVVVMINKKAVPLTEQIKDGDEVAILPPVSGG